MKLALFTSNAIRHKYVANILASHADECLIISECKPLVPVVTEKSDDLIQNHFALRDLTEARFFSGNDFFRYKSLPVVHGEANHPYVYYAVREFSPDLMIVYGASIIREPLLSLLPRGRFLNLHLGLSPFYRGSGTNFFPFVNNELEYVGSTILHIDAGIDTGDIVCHVLPEINSGDNVHTVGCKVIVNSVNALIRIMDQVREGKKLNRIKQWSGKVNRYYRKRDFNEDILKVYLNNLENGMVEDFVGNKVKAADLIEI